MCIFLKQFYVGCNGKSKNCKSFCGILPIENIIWGVSISFLNITFSTSPCTINRIKRMLNVKRKYGISEFLLLYAINVFIQLFSLVITEQTHTLKYKNTM